MPDQYHEDRKLILHRLDSIEAWAERHEERLDEINQAVVTLRAVSGMWGAIAGAIASAIGFVLGIVFKF